MRILTIEDKADKKILLKKSARFDFEKRSKKEIHDIVRKMKKVMREADGIGLAANQIGINEKFFVAEVDEKFYSIFNPEIAEKSEVVSSLEQSCLSVPGESVEIDRPEMIVVKGYDKNGKRIKVKAWGLLSQVFQHEIDHLEGKLITDYKKK